jgi:VCBS repeat-containing protein
VQSGVLSASVVARSGPMAGLQLLAEDGTKLFETSPRTDDNSASGYIEAGSKYYVRVVGGLGEDCYYCVVSPPSEYLVNLSLAPGDAPAAPVALADNADISEDAGPMVIPVLANDTDVDAADTKRVVAVSSPGVAAIVQVPPSGNGVTFYPNRSYEHLKAGESVVETFSYTMEDSFGLQSTATVAVTVNGQNDAPVAVTDSVTVAKNAGPVTIDVLINDTDVDAGDTKTVVGVDGSETPGWIELILIYGVGVGQWHPGTPAIQGTVSVSADGSSVTYDPGDAFASLSAGQTAIESFRYTMVDSAGAEQTGVVVVTITGESGAAAPASVVAAAPTSPASMRSPRARAAVALASAEAKSRPRRSVETVRAAGTLTAAARNTARRLSAASVDVVFARATVNAE